MALTGYTAGLITSERAKQEKEGRAQTQIIKQSEFLEWLDTRAERRDVLSGQASIGRTTTAAEEERTKYTKTKYKAGTRKEEEYIAVAEEEEDLRRAELSRNINTALRGIHTDQVNAASQIFSGIADDEEITDQNYDMLYQQASSVLGEGFLEGVGITETNTPQGREAVQILKNQTIHTQETLTKEHLMPLELYWKNKLAQAKAGGIKPESVLGKMQADQDSYIQEAMQYQKDSPMYNRAMSKYNLMQEQIDSYLGKEQAVSESKQEENFKSFITSTFPTFSEDLESDRASTETANIFIKNVYNELSNLYGERTAKHMLQRYYEYDANYWDDNKFVVRDVSGGVQYSAEVQANLETIDQTIRQLTGLRNLGVSGREILVQEILDREKRETEQLKKDIYEQTYPKVKTYE